MSLLPGLLGLTAGRSFSFYPPINGIAHNEWRFRRATWSEFVVVNTQTGDEAGIPRSFVGDVSANAPVIIVGLKRELAWQDGMAIPYRRPVVELPIAVNDFVPAARPSRPAQIVSIRLEPRAPANTGRKAVVVVMLGVVASAIAADIFRPESIPDAVRDRIGALRVSHSYLQLKPGDDYTAVVAKLGAPATQRTFYENGGFVYRSLDYPRLRFTAVLEGHTDADALYIGSVDARGRILGAEKISEVADKLRSIPRF